MNLSSFARTGCRDVARLLALALMGAAASASQTGSTPTCEHGWLRALGGRPGVEGRVEALGVFDDGGGPSLAVGGVFTKAGGSIATNVARWDGTDWRAMGALSDAVQALCEFDPGSGPALHAGGWFTHADGQPVGFVARWDGQAWVAMGGGLNGVALTLTVHDDGNGPALYAGGLFSLAGGAPAANVARWDGVSWQALGAGVNDVVHTLVSHDDGSGPALYAGGVFSSAGGIPAQGIARRRGGSWSAVGGGVVGHVRAMAVLDSGSGPELYAGGNFTQAGGVAASRVARWDGSAWSALGAGVDNQVWTMVAHDDGGGAQLYVGGNFSLAGGVPSGRFARWSGSAWSPLPNGPLDGQVKLLASFDDGSGPALMAGGDFYYFMNYEPVRGLMQLRAGVWSGVGRGPDGVVKTMASCDLGGGPELYMSGTFRHLDGILTRIFARWNGIAWQEIRYAVDARDMLVFDDGNGPSLFVTGLGIAIPPGTGGQAIGRYDGQVMHTVGGGLNNIGHALAIYDDGTGPALYVGGQFTQAGGVAASRIARWNGTNWSALGSGSDIDGFVYSLVEHDDGSGPSLFVSGNFSTVGGASMNGIARWDGAAWHSVGGGLAMMASQSSAMAVFDDGNGPQLYATGNFSGAGGVAASHIARWDGSSWHALGTGLDGRGVSLCVYDDGSGPALYVGGDFHHAGGIPASRIARWNGTTWSALGRGVGLHMHSGPEWPSSMVVHELVPGEGAALLVGGYFDGVLDSGDSFLARWGCMGGGPVGVDYCFGDGSGNPCPCANHGVTGAGCGNSASQGARLSAVGSASVSSADLVLEVQGLPPLRPGLFFQGTTRVNGGQGVPFGDGLRCAGGALARLQVAYAGSDGRAATSIGIAGLGSVAPGDVRTYQFWYRDPFGPCGSGFNLTQGLGLHWAP